MDLSEHEQNILIDFAEKQFKDLPSDCIKLFKEEPKLPGYGNVVAEDELLTMKISLSLSLCKSYEMYSLNKGNISLDLADLFAQEYSSHLSELILEVLTNKEDSINTNISKLLRYCKIEKSPIIITSPKVATEFTKERSFIASDITGIEMAQPYFYELGKIKNTKIIIDPLQINESFAYLLTGNIIDYKMGESDEEFFATYNISENGEDIIAIFKPVTLFYRIDLTGLNFKFFNIIEND